MKTMRLRVIFGSWLVMKLPMQLILYLLPLCDHWEMWQRIKLTSLLSHGDFGSSILLLHFSIGDSRRRSTTIICAILSQSWKPPFNLPFSANTLKTYEMPSSTGWFVMSGKVITQQYNNLTNWLYCRYCYQHQEGCISACTLPIHGLLHVADDISACGPPWATWTFFLECYCGTLKSALKSKRHPWGNLNKWVLNIAYLQQMHVRYDVSEELPSNSWHNMENVSERDMEVEDCMLYTANYKIALTHFRYRLYPSSSKVAWLRAE